MKNTVKTESKLRPVNVSKAKRDALKEKGFEVTTVADFLGLTPEDEAWIEMKLALRRKVVELRQHQGISQGELARKLNSGQGRVSKLEAGDPSVGYDLLFRSLLALGATPAEIGKTIATVKR